MRLLPQLEQGDPTSSGPIDIPVTFPSAQVEPEWGSPGAREIITEYIPLDNKGTIPEHWGSSTGVEDFTPKTSRTIISLGNYVDGVIPPFTPSGDGLDSGMAELWRQAHPISSPFTTSPIGDTNVFPNPVGNIEGNLSTTGTTYTTMENNPIGTNPDTVPTVQSPFNEVRTLMDLFNNDLGTTSAVPYTQPSEPGVTVIPPATSDSDGSSWVLWLGVLGIVVTLGAHWYFNRKG